MPQLKILRIGEPENAMPDGRPPYPGEDGAVTVHRVDVAITGHGKKIRGQAAGDSYRVQLVVPSPYSRADLVAAAKAALTEYPAAHPDEGQTLEVV